MCIHILYKFQGQKKKKRMNVHLRTITVQATRKIGNMYRGPSQLMHYENTDTHDNTRH